jgi:hypothetical protein
VEEVFCNSILGFSLNVFVVWTPSILPNPAMAEEAEDSWVGFTEQVAGEEALLMQAR